MINNILTKDFIYKFTAHDLSINQPGLIDNPYHFYHSLNDANDNVIYHATGKEKSIGSKLDVFYGRSNKKFALIKSIKKEKDYSGKKWPTYIIESSDVGVSKMKMFVHHPILSPKFYFIPCNWCVIKKAPFLYEFLNENNEVRAKWYVSSLFETLVFKYKEDEKLIALLYFALQTHNNRGRHDSNN